MLLALLDLVLYKLIQYNPVLPVESLLRLQVLSLDNLELVLLV
jgi:hypothetical protein